MKAHHILRDHLGWIVSAALLQCGAAILWWGLNAPLDIWPLIAGYAISAVVGFAIGRKASTEEVFGVAWRIGLGWFLIWSLIEYLVAGRNSVYSTSKFLELFVGHSLVIGGAYLLAGVLTARTAPRHKWTMLEIIQALGAIAAIVAVVIALAQPAPTENQTSSGEQEQTQREVAPRPRPAPSA